MIAPDATSVKLSRRHSLKLMAGLPVLGLPALGLAGGGFAAIPSLEDRLKADLAQVVITPGPAQLELVGFFAEDGRIEASLRLRWPPGTRQRRFRIEKEDGEHAYTALWDEIVTTFSALS